MTTLPDALSVDSKTAAEILGIPEPTLRTWRCRQKNGPPFVRISETKVVYMVDDLRAYLEVRRVVPAHMKIAAQAKPWEKGSGESNA